MRNLLNIRAHPLSWLLQKIVCLKDDRHTVSLIEVQCPLTQKKNEANGIDDENNREDSLCLLIIVSNNTPFLPDFCEQFLVSFDDADKVFT